MKLSIIVPVYNHEKYIVQALDSILMQNIQYSYEVLVGEDCSTDNTRKILQKYEQAHPGIFTIFYREQNLNSSPGLNNFEDLYLRSKGEYAIALEGDDFWTEPNKINRQIAFLDEHPEYIAVSHNCIIVDQNGHPTGEQYPECKKSEYTIDDWNKKIYAGHTTTLLFRNIFNQKTEKNSILYKKLIPGDYIFLFVFLTYGRVHCIQETMSAYRHVKHTGSSFSATHKHDPQQYRNYCREIVLYAHSTDKYILDAENKYIKCLYYHHKAQYITQKQMNDCLKELKIKKNIKKQLLYLSYTNFRMQLSKFKKTLLRQ